MKYLLVDLSRIDKVEYLHPDECIEDESKMSRIVLCFIECCGVIWLSVWSVESATANITPYDPVQPFVLRVGHVYSVII